MTEQPKHAPPHGMEKYDLGGKDDLGALSLAQQADLNQFKVRTSDIYQTDRVETLAFSEFYQEISDLRCRLYIWV